MTTKTRLKVRGIYGLQCSVNGKIYIGSSQSVRKRMAYHRNLLRGNKHWNPYLQEDWNIYGGAKFNSLILQECAGEDLLELESAWMDKFGSKLKDKGYNVVGVDFKESELEGTHKKRKSLNPKRNRKSIVAINILTSEIVIFSCCKEAGIALNFKEKRVNECLNYWKGVKGTRSYRGYIFVRKEEYDKEFDYVNYTHPKKARLKKEKVKKESIPYADRNIARKPIKIVDKEGNEETFTSILEAVKKYSFVRNKVTKCLRSDKYTHRGYYFYFINKEG